MSPAGSCTPHCIHRSCCCFNPCPSPPLLSSAPSHPAYTTPRAQVEELTFVPHVSRELMLIKVSCSSTQRGELVSLASVRAGWVRLLRAEWGAGAEVRLLPRCACSASLPLSTLFRPPHLAHPAHPARPPCPPHPPDLPRPGVRRGRQHADPGGDGQGGQDGGAQGGTGAVRCGGPLLDSARDAVGHSSGRLAARPCARAFRCPAGAPPTPAAPPPLLRPCRHP